MTNFVRNDLSPLGGGDIDVTFYPPSKFTSMPHDAPSFPMAGTGQGRSLI
jgi:hypothetical protein